MNVAARILKLFGWSVTITVPDRPKCIICVAPHTSNWDFVLGKLAYASVDRHAGFLMKASWFFPPLSWIFKAMGGIPVERKRKTVSLTAAVTRMFLERPALHIAITPEGTRSRVSKWHTGFLHIAHDAGIPIELGVIDYATRTITVTTEFQTTGDADADMKTIKAFYRSTGAQGKISENFTTD